jgi:hypothetical protein
MYKQDIKTIISQYIIFFIVYLLYSYDKRFGIMLSFFGLLTAWRLKKIDKYPNTTIIKAYLVLSTAFITFLTVTNTISEEFFNKTATMFIMINILALFLYSILYYDSIDKKIICIIIAILFIVITTPTLKYMDNQIVMKSNIINKNLWIVLQTIVLLTIYLTNPLFFMNINIYNVLFSLLAPMILHFSNNKWLESRALFLNLFIIIDLFN